MSDNTDTDTDARAANPGVREFHPLRPSRFISYAEAMAESEAQVAAEEAERAAAKAARQAEAEAEAAAAAASEPPLLFKGGDRAVVTETGAPVADRAPADERHHPQTPSSEEEGAFPEPQRIPHPAEFTPERRMRFCDDLSGHGNVRMACARAGVSPHTAYKARRRLPEFARCWDVALELAREDVQAVLADRALEGIAEPLFHRGEQVGVRRHYDTRLLLAHLARLDARCADADDEPADFDALLAGVGGLASAALQPRADYTEVRSRVVEQAGFAALDEKLDAALAAGEAGADYDADDDNEDCEEEADYDERAVDAVLAAGDAERELAGAHWDAERAELLARLDALLAGEGAVPADLPYEIKSWPTIPVRPEPVEGSFFLAPEKGSASTSSARTDLRGAIPAPMNPVTPVTPCVPARGRAGSVAAGKGPIAPALHT